MPRIFVKACLVIALVSIASADPVMKPTTTSITRITVGITRGRETIDLVKHEVVDLVAGKHRHLDDDEVAGFVAAWHGIAQIEAAKPSEGAPPGGSMHYKFHDRSGAVTLVSFANGTPPGTRYVALKNDDWVRLADAWPLVAGKKQPPTVEHLVKEFLTEAIFGPPGGPRNLPVSLARLDPDHTRFGFVDLKTGPLAIQIEPKTPLGVGELAKELEVVRPIAYLANGEHHVWQLGDADKPLLAWRGAELAVILAMPPSTKIHSYHGQIESIDGATIERIELRATN